MKMSVAKKMLMLTLISVLGLIGLAVFNHSQMLDVFDETNYANTNIVPSMVELDKIRFKFNTLRIRLANHTLIKEPEKMAEVEAAIQKLQTELADLFKNYETYIADDKEKQMLEADKAGLNEYYVRMEPILNASRVNNKALAHELYIAIRIPAEKANAELAAHIDYKMNLGQVTAEAAATVKNRAGKLNILLSALILLATAVIGYLITCNLRKQLGGEPDEVAEIANRIANGDLNSPIDLKDGDNASLMVSMQKMQKTLKSVIDAQTEMAEENKAGNINAVIDADHFHGSYKTMTANVNHMAANQADVMRKVTACIAEFANGNFNAPLEQFPGQRAFINEGVELLRNNIKTIISDMEHM